MSLALLIEWNSNLFILAGRFPHQVQRTEATQENKKTVILPAAAAAAVAAAAAAAKSLQSCQTLCDCIDGSPPGPAIPGILQ